LPFCEGGKVGGNGNFGSTPYLITLTHSLKILSVTSKNDLKNHRKRISENSHAIIEEISLAENLENDRGDIILYDNGLPRGEQGQLKDFSTPNFSTPATTPYLSTPDFAMMNFSTEEFLTINF
jgi:hypothetical protein